MDLRRLFATRKFITGGSPDGGATFDDKGHAFR
jgi:hypothetical protein